MYSEDTDVDKTEFESFVKDGVVYPLADGIKSRICYTDSLLDWANASKVTLPSGEQVDMPWVDGGSLPFYMQQKLSPDNGWELIAHTMYPENQSNRAYLLFHNYITGTLRVFCYMSTFVTNNNGYWKITFSEPTALLNFTEAIAAPMDESTKSEIVVSNSTTQSGKGFSLGWNGFQLDLAYDSNLSGIMKIEAMNHNTSNIVINGDYDSSTNGTIVGTESSSTTVSSLIDGVGQLAGSAAEDWLKSKIPFLGNNSSVSGTLLSMAKEGIGSAFGLFSGLFEKETETVKNINLTTHGTVKVQGTMMNESAAPIVPVNIHLDMINTSLGGWNLATIPTLQWYTTVFNDSDTNANVTNRIYTYKVPGIQNTSYTISANPKTTIYFSSLNYKHVGYCGWTYSNTGNMEYGKNAMLSIMPAIYDDNQNVMEDFSSVNLCLHIPMPEYPTSENLPFLLNVPEAQEIYNIEEYDMKQNMNVYLQVSVHQEFVINGVTNEYIANRIYECKHDWGSEY